MIVVLLPRRLSVPAVLVTAVAVAVALGVSQAHLGDVAVYRTAGRALFAGDLYRVGESGLGFTYPPFAASLFAPLARLPLPVMFGVLTAVSAAAAVVVLRCSLPRHPLAATALRVAPLVLVQPVVSTLAWGQVNLVLAALVLVDLLVVRNGALVGFAAAVKLTPAIFVLYLLLCGRTREARNAALGFGAAGAFGTILAPTDSWRYWTHDAFVGTGVGGFDHTANQSVRGLAERLLGTGPGVTVWLVLAGPLLALGLLLARRVGRDGQELLAAGIVGVTGCLVSPVSWTHHWVWCVPCLVVLRGLAKVVLAVVLFNPVPFGHVLGSGYAIVAVAALLAGWFRSGRAPSRSPVASAGQVRPPISPAAPPRVCGPTGRFRRLRRGRWARTCRSDEGLRRGSRR